MSRSEITNIMIIGNNIRLRTKRLADARDDYHWQTDHELTQLDATSPPDVSFSQYLSEYAFELSSPSSSRREFAIETMDGKHIGNCVYYDVKWDKREAELGVMIGDRSYWDKGYGADAITTLLNHIFRQTNLERVYLKTLDWNMRAQKCFQKCSFKPYGNMARDGYSFVLMEIHRKQWQEQVKREAKMESAKE